MDHVCGSRLVLGLGSGFSVPETEEEFRAVRAEFSGRAGRLDGTVALWHTAWQRPEDGGSVDFTGRHFQAEGLDRLPPPHGPGGPPLWLAGSGTPRVVERVARHYDGWMPFLPYARAYGEARDRVQRTREAAGRRTPSRPPCTTRSPSTRTPHGRAP
ncbi:LLM class flavin-dependent oxidoreductase [Streptomyces tagetis]|uniref:LLM class flavin-dependent oxidoreductase n=1 Tax=Streptomyces tagetis TaxID=2820809 RepID=UPI0024919138|nr:LLM class flavin-dependent oxidoreductase [Streptomyces sp. RG38]